MGSLIELSNITSGLTSDCKISPFISLEALEADAQGIFDKLDREDANQFILIYNLPEPIRQRLDDDCKTVLEGIPFRLMFEGDIGLIKIIPNFYHGNITSRLRDIISFASFLDAGASRDDILWSGRTTFLTGDKGKQADECFVSPSRFPSRCAPPRWPTLVIETGISESKLREDAKWWFQNSLGAVRTVITLNIYRTRRTVLLEKWQLSPAGQPVTTAMAQTSDRMIPPMPPLGLQSPEVQDPFIAEKATITPDATVGRLYLHFHALFDRAPGPTERDLDMDLSLIMRLL